MKIKQAVIIAGGVGSRLKEHGCSTPKSLLRFGDKTLLEIQIRNFMSSGISNFLILTGYGSDQIIQEIEKIKSKYAIKVEHIVESVPLGTGGALVNALSRLDVIFFVLYGDILVDFNLRIIFPSLELKEADGYVLYRPSEHPEDSNILSVDFNNYVYKIHSKGDYSSYNLRNNSMVGMYLLTRKIFSSYANHFKFAKLDLDEFLLSQIDNKSIYLKAKRFVGFAKDIGTPDRLEKANDEWLNAKFYLEKKRTIFLDRDGVINRLNGHIRSIHEFHISDNFMESIAIFRQLEFRIFVVTNQPGISKGFYSWNDLDIIHGTVDNLLSRQKLYLDGWYICPHYPQIGFENEIQALKIECSCRKPDDGLIRSIKTQFPVLEKESFVVGDTQTDYLMSQKSDLNFVQIGNEFYDSRIKLKFENLYNFAQYLLKMKESSI